MKGQRHARSEKFTFEINLINKEPSYIEATHNIHRNMIRLQVDVEATTDIINTE